MSIHSKIHFSIIILIFLINILFCINATGCKDIIAVGDATEGENNLLLKVRDPSRPGPQVLCIIPKGYEYTYHHPWFGSPMKFINSCKYIGVATIEDTIPNLVKAGMVISDSGIAYGDADTGSNWKNPTRNGWDDFDWIRYACEKAKNEDEAVTLFTEECVDKLHASKVSENIFIVGPQKAFVIEADAYRYSIKEISDVVVMTNYPKELWKTQWRKTLPIASSFDSEKEKFVTKGRTIRLNSIYGVRILDIGDGWIVARQAPFIKIYNHWIRVMGKRVKINLGERKTVGDYSVELLDIQGKKAKVRVQSVFKAWEEKMLEYISSRYGEISVRDMITWSRLHEEDLDGLRPMCEDYFPYESVIIYCIPSENYEILSSGWFSANHACSTIYVPIHIVDSEIYEPYTTGEAAKLSLELLDLFGHDALVSKFENVEDVFLNETSEYEKISVQMILNNSILEDIITTADINMQKQAYLTEQIWLEIGKKSIGKYTDEYLELIGNMWKDNYYSSLELMLNSVENFYNAEEIIIEDKILDIVFSICESKLYIAQAIGKDISELLKKYESGKREITKSNYKQGSQLILESFNEIEILINGFSLFDKPIDNSDETPNKMSFEIISILFIIVIIFLFLLKRKS